MTSPFAPPVPVVPPVEPPYTTSASSVLAPPPTPPPTSVVIAEPVLGHRRRGSGRGQRAVGITLVACVLLTGGAFAIGRATKNDTKSVAPATSQLVATTPVVSVVSSAPTAALDVAKVVATISPSVVKVAVDIKGAQGAGEGVGTGVILTTDGEILTNAHVVADATQVRVVLGKAEPVDAKVLGVDIGNDLALVKIDGKDLPVMKIAPSDQVRVGEPVVAMGYALDLEGDPSVTSGIISALNRSMITDSGALDGLLQTDAAISSGNSGGPLVNAAGELIGINTAVATGGANNTANNIGFAIATNEIQRLLPRLRTGGTKQPAQGYLGIGVSNRHDGGRGAIVTDVQAGSPAGKLGLSVGDVVTKVSGVEINGQGGLIGAIRDSAPGDRVTIEYERSGKTMTGEVTLDARPAG